jgi:hypothetical protein
MQSDMTQRNGSKAAARLDPAPAGGGAGPIMYLRRLTSVARAPRRIGAALLALAAACGGGGSGSHPDTYRHATLAQEQCCEHLGGPARDQCLGAIVRVDDPAVASSSTNQQTFACVQDHFECDPATGRASRRSAQAQLDCIADLSQ